MSEALNNKDILRQMTAEEKISLCCGAGFWQSAGFEKYGIPALFVADGPNGVRCQSKKGDMLGIHESLPATCFPASVSIACSWDRALAGEIGAAIAGEALEYSVHIVLGPGLNIKRNPLCGRNFEYYSEDPYLSGQLGAAFVKRGQEKGVGSCLKHFAANSQEYKRFSSDGHIDERTLREIYFPAFEQAVRAAKPAMVMCAYNKINGTYCSENKWLLTGVLREEWGFDGVVVTDWGGMRDRTQGFKSGCDWSMPGGVKHLRRHAVTAYREGRLTQGEIDLCADRMLVRALASAEAGKNKKKFDRGAHHILARRAAAESAVLLKNDGMLPLKTESVALIGHMAQKPRYQGSGSSHINPTRLSAVSDTATAWSYAPGCDEHGDTTDTLIAEAVETATAAEAAVVVAGLPDRYESEGFDRDDMKMPEGHIRMIEAVSKANPNTAVILLCGSPVEMDWIDQVRAVLYMGLPGQAGGEAALDLMTGGANPGGRLAETWPVRYEDVPCAGYYGKPRRDAQYREGIYTGYRYYETAKVPVRFPFGFGLSYTEFEYSGLEIDGFEVSVTVKNTGTVRGSEVVQLYIAPPGGGIHRPARELKGFEKVSLEPGESGLASFYLDERSFAIWDDGWRVQEGRYEVQIAANAHDIKLSAEIEVDGETIPVPGWQTGSWYAAPSGYPPKADFEAMLGRTVTEPQPARKGRFTNENSILELSEQSRTLRIVKFIVERVVAAMNGGRADYRNPDFRMAAASSVDGALFSLVITSGGWLPERVALGLVEIANGHFWRGVGRMFRA